MKTSLTLFFTALLAIIAQAQPRLNSLRTATATIYLDFDGEQVTSPVWNNGIPMNCAAPALSNNQITEIFNRVSEDYRPFNINVTTDIEKYLAAPYDKRIRVIVTPTSSWFSGVGGIAFVGSFTWGDDTPCFVFNDRLGSNNAKMIAECCSHESGHALGLSHQSSYDGSCNLTATYNEGAGTGEAAWAPIMGNSYSRNMSGWNNGPTPYGCSNVQDNLSIITTRNGFTYREDDYADNNDISTHLLQANNIEVSGIISTNNDKDAFRIQLDYAANFHLEARPFGVGDNNEGADLDLRLSLYDEFNNLIRVYNPANTMSVTVDSVLKAGTYYIVVDGTGNSYASDYGSLGSYSLKGISGVLPVCNVNLEGEASDGIHQLHWNIVCNETIRGITLQQSADGIHFTDLHTITLTQTTLATRSYYQGNAYYRLQIKSGAERITYSNTLLLKQPEAAATTMMVAGLVRDNIDIRTAGKYQYQLLDINGNQLSKGNGPGGSSMISLYGKPAGIYILQLSSDQQRKVFRLIKQ